MASREARVRPKVLRGDCEVVDVVVLQLPYLGRGGYGDFVQAVLSVHYQGMLAAQAAQRYGHLLPQRAVRHAQNLASRARRVGERPKYVEHRAYAYLPPGRAGESHGGMECGSEHEANPHLPDAPLHTLRPQVYFDSRGFQDVGAAARAGHGAVAVLGNLEARARG